MELKWGGKMSGGLSWKLNETLLTDPDTDRKIREEIERFFEENETEDVSLATVWEAHKAYVRGILIAIGAKKKRERREKISGLLKEIAEMELLHKNNIRKEIEQRV
ncbi:unnamed protein product, partial [Staurois parvus]